MQLTTSTRCHPNTAYTIGGLSWAAKRRIQRKALHRCRKSKTDNKLSYNCLSKEVWSKEKQRKN